MPGIRLLITWEGWLQTTFVHQPFLCSQMQIVKATLSGSLRRGNERRGGDSIDTVTTLTKKLRSSNMIIDHPPSGDKVVLGEWHRGIVGLVVCREQTVGLTGEFSFSSIVT